MSREVIAIDVDDVVADSTESLRLLVNKRTGSSLTKENYRIPGEYSRYYERVWEKHGLSELISYETLGDDMVYDQAHIPLNEGAKEAISKLSQNYDLVIVTARDPAWKPATVRWLSAHFDSLFHKVIFTRSDIENSPEKSKGEVCIEVGASWLIDDNVEHCQSALDVGIRAIIFGTYGWHHDIPPSLVRCKNWLEVEKHFHAQG